MAPVRPVGGVMEATFIFNTLSCATVCLLAYMWHDPTHQLQWAGWYFQCTDSTWRLTNNKLWHVFTSCHIHLKLSSSWMYFLFITFIVFVLFPGVFNSAEAWRQCHIGHDVEGKTAASMWDWHNITRCSYTSNCINLKEQMYSAVLADLFSVSCLCLFVSLLSFSCTNKQTCRRRRTASSESWAPSPPPTSSRKSSTSPSRYTFTARGLMLMLFLRVISAFKPACF